MEFEMVCCLGLKMEEQKVTLSAPLMVKQMVNLSVSKTDNQLANLKALMMES